MEYYFPLLKYDLFGSVAKVGMDSNREKRREIKKLYAFAIIAGGMLGYFKYTGFLTVSMYWLAKFRIAPVK